MDYDVFCCIAAVGLSLKGPAAGGSAGGATEGVPLSLLHLPALTIGAIMEESMWEELILSTMISIE